MSNPQFPVAAEPVRQKIMELAKRPQELPQVGGGNGPTALGWTPGAMCPWLMIPTGMRHDLVLKDSDCGLFFKWWDSCTDAQEAVDTVWGKKR